MTNDRNAQRDGTTAAPETQQRPPLLLALTRMAALLVDEARTVTYWNRAARELLHRAPNASAGERFDDLLRFPDGAPDGLDISGDAPPRYRTGECDAALRDRSRARIAWWLYPLTCVDDARVLLLACDAEAMRRYGPGLAADDEPLIPPRTRDHPEPSPRITGAEPVMSTVPHGEGARLRRNLAQILPRMGPEKAESIVSQVLDGGYPAVDVTASIRLPFAPYWGDFRQGQQGDRPSASARQRADGRVEWAGQDSPEAYVMRQQLSFLNDASAHIGSTLDLSKTVTELCDVLVPRFTDFAGVQLLDEVVTGDAFPKQPSPDADSVMRRVAVVHNEEHGRWDDVVPEGEVMRLPYHTPFVQCMTTGKSVNITCITREASDKISAQFDNRDLRPLLEDRAMLIVPLIARNTVLGNFILIRRPDRSSFDDMDTTTAEQLAHRAALSMDNARLYGQEARDARALQQSMLPKTPPLIPGVEIAHRYLPSAKQQVGGDWFEAIPLPGNKVGLIVGDVMGHGMDSASAMSQYRAGARALATYDPPPHELLRHLDILADDFGNQGDGDGDLYLATCVYIVYDPEAGRCEAAGAGHLPPVLIEPNGESYLLDLPSGVSIGAGKDFGIDYETVSFEAPAGSRLALCTDGLVEVRGQDIGRGLATLCAELAGGNRTLDDACTAITNALHTEERDDDVALLMASLRGLPE